MAKLKDWLDANLCKGKLKEGICSIETLCGKLREGICSIETLCGKLKEAVSQRWSVKKVFLKILQNSQENTCARVSFLIKLLVWGLQLCLEKTPAQVFSCEFSEISKNTFFTEHLQATTSVFKMQFLSFSRSKYPKFFLAEPFFLVL